MEHSTVQSKLDKFITAAKHLVDSNDNDIAAATYSYIRVIEEMINKLTAIDGTYLDIANRYKTNSYHSYEEASSKRTDDAIIYYVAPVRMYFNIDIKNSPDFIYSFRCIKAKNITQVCLTTEQQKLMMMYDGDDVEKLQERLSEFLKGENIKGVSVRMFGHNPVNIHVDVQDTYNNHQILFGKIMTFLSIKREYQMRTLLNVRPSINDEVHGSVDVKEMKGVYCAADLDKILKASSNSHPCTYYFYFNTNNIVNNNTTNNTHNNTNNGIMSGSMSGDANSCSASSCSVSDTQLDTRTKLTMDFIKSNSPCDKSVQLYHELYRDYMNSIKLVALHQSKMNKMLKNMGYTKYTPPKTRSKKWRKKEFAE